MSGGPNYYYTWAPAQPTATRVTTSRTELLHIGIAYIVLTVDLILILSGAGLLFGNTSQIASLVTPIVILTAAAAALTGFVCHELAHKIVAQRHGFWAEFRMSPFGLVFSLFTATFGFLFAAPGATVVSGMSPVDLENWGRTSLAGPLSNLGFGSIFLVSGIGVYLARSPYFLPLFFLAYINGWFATFNLIPLGPLDGAKVLRWRKSVWVAALIVVAAFTLFAFLAWAYGTPFFVS